MAFVPLVENLIRHKKIVGLAKCHKISRDVKVASMEHIIKYL